jgi:hypothetical protein
MGKARLDGEDETVTEKERMDGKDKTGRENQDWREKTRQ